MASNAPDDAESIAEHVRACFAAFQAVSIGLAKAEITIKCKIPTGGLNDELGRFRLWCANMAAHKKGRSSLEYKLREASHIRERVLELLRNLETVLQEVTEIVTGKRIPWEDLSDSESEFSNDDAVSGHPDTTELKQLLSNTAEITTCLMRLSMAIRNPAPHDQFKESGLVDTSHFEAFDIDHVRGKFPKAEEWFTVRLGKAISRRRQYLQYRDGHRKRLGQGLETIETAPSSDEAATTTISQDKIESTVASSIPLALKATESRIGLAEDECYEDILSQTSYASTSDNSERLRPPPVPKQARDGNPFECPVCFRIIAVRQVAAWQ
ncbi:hypothetical protein BCR34DRAFT_276309 [Clohesyomyces aquaticus]|uniref:Fungal N-terminal domain-containing protein n=1 Tax=Clohesyomyces aquaticus TaxID=1231657 RepID=A0A1Y1ZSG4_9PLEO|nr:hypothetical protein BCR34DRAFT_276309 [Clohesyomyces aquaticus]